MAAYGEYETFEEHHRGARTSVWQARRRGETGAEVFAVKVCHLHEWDDETVAQRDARGAAFCEAAEQQAHVSGRRARHWMPVLATGRNGAEAFWVGPFYPRSLTRVIEGRVELPHADLHWLVSAMVRGLMDLDAEAQRPHGGLSPSNIFISGENRLRGADVFLSDLKPKSALASGADRAGDFHALGRIIVNVVRRRGTDFRATIGWPIEPGAEWERLGRHGHAWLDLCNQLLKPHATGADLDLDAVHRTLVRMAPEERPGWIRPAITTASVVAVVAGGTLALRTVPYDSIPEFLKTWAERVGNKGQVVQTVPEEWRKLCEAYYDWLARLLSDLEHAPNRAMVSGQAYLRENVLDVLADVRAEHGWNDPRVPGANPNLQELATHPPASVLTTAGVRHTKAVWSAVQRVGDAIRTWPERTRLKNTAVRFEALGWKSPAAEINALLNRPFDASLMATLRAIATLSRSVDAVDAQWSAMLVRHEQQDNRDAVLAGAMESYRIRISVAGTVEALQQQVTAFARELERLASAAADRAGVDYDRFRRESFVNDFRGPVDANAIERWERELADYRWIAPENDPRGAANLTGLKRQLAEAQSLLAETEKDTPERSGEVIRLRGECQSAAEGIEALSKAKLVRKDAARALEEAKKFQNEVGAIRSRVEKLRPDPAARFEREELLRVRSESRIEAVVAVARNEKLALALAAWRRLGELPGWATATNLRREAETLEALQKRIEIEVGSSGRQEIRDELAAEGARRWRTALRAAHDDQAVADVMALRNRFGIRDDALAGRERFNVLLHGLKQIDWQVLSEADATKRRAEAVRQMRACMAPGDDQETTRWLETLAEIALTTQGAPVDMTRQGPAVAGWSGELSADGSRLTYRSRRPGLEHELVFHWVAAERVAPFFLCTTELPVGLMLDLLAKPEVRDRLFPVLKRVAGNRSEDDPRQGPAVWRTDLRGVQLSHRWLIPRPGWKDQLYPDDVPVGPPTRKHPVQYLPPEAALIVARDVLGCRLPSPEEWNEVAATGRVEVANLRDALWQRAHDNFISLGVRGDSPFASDLARPGEAVPLKADRTHRSATTRNDGLIWFAEVATGGGEPFHHLWGNVAEFLYDEAKDRFYVAGGSAMSPPEIDPAKPFAVDATRAAGGFADVGFRLALSASGGMAGRNELKRLIYDRPYLRL